MHSSSLQVQVNSYVNAHDISLKLWLYFVQMMMWHLTVLLVIGQALGQAPGDFNPACRTGRNALRHIFPADWTILMDSFDYSSLIGSSAANPVWVQDDFDDNGFQVRELYVPCTHKNSELVVLIVLMPRVYSYLS